MDVYLLEEQSCQISSRSSLKRWCLRLFWKTAPQQEQEEQQDEQRYEIIFWSKNAAAKMPITILFYELKGKNS